MQEIKISKYWQKKLKKQTATIEDLKEGATYVAQSGRLVCDQCCGFASCTDPEHTPTDVCSYCLGSGTNKSCFDKKGNRLKQVSEQ